MTEPAEQMTHILQGVLIHCDIDIFVHFSVKDMLTVTSNWYKLYRHGVAMMIAVTHETQHCCFWYIISFLSKV